MTLALFTLHRRMILFVTSVMVLLGLMSFFQMPRQEDPKITERFASATVLYPGAPPEKIERLIVRPIEDELASVDELKYVDVEIRLNVAIFRFELRESIRNIEAAWREVERAIDRVEPKLPGEATRVTLDFNVLDQEAILFAVTGSDDLRSLLHAARQIKDELLTHPQVARVQLFGDPGEEIRIEVDPKQLDRRGIPVSDVVTTVSLNHRGGAAGFLTADGIRHSVLIDNDAPDMNWFKNLQLETRDLNVVSLGEIAKIEWTLEDPPATLFRWNSKPAIGIGVVPKPDLNIVSFGRSLMRFSEEIAAGIQPLALETVAFQPRRTEVRLNDLTRSLLLGMLLIAGFLFLTMGAWTAIIVALSVPAISLIGLFLFYLTGGVLHQISIAAFVISIGQFIDNIIVIVDAMKRRIEAGSTPTEASIDVHRELRSPMLFATLSGICAFLPMLASQGSTADFVFSLPLVAVLTLISSYFYALYFVPIAALQVISRERTRSAIEFGISWLERAFSALAVGPMYRVAGLVSLIAILSLISFISMKKEFFPEADRNEFLFSMELDPAADITATDLLVKEVESWFLAHPHVTSVASFSGGSIPRFYYNLPDLKRSPQVGQLLVTTRDLSDVKKLGLLAEDRYRSIYPNRTFVSHFLQQGPPINAKIEFRVFGSELARMVSLADEIEAMLKNDSGARAVRSDAKLALSTIKVTGVNAALASVHLPREAVRQVAAFHSSGIVVSEFRAGRELIPVRIRSSATGKSSLEGLRDALVLPGRAKDFRVRDLSILENGNETSVIHRRNSERFVRVLSDLAPGATFDEVMTRVGPRVRAIPLQSGERIGLGGDLEGAQEANLAIFKVVPLAMLFLVVFLLAQFGSFRKLAIALLALPIPILGVFPGLWLGGAPFGFMSLLGLLALVGIAINNIILLMEAMGSTGSIRQAIELRFRAIMMTTILTLIGLLPLVLERSTLWPPLGWTMISGLITGTVGTLIVVPTLYRVVFRTRALVGLVAILVSSGVSAQNPVTLSELMDRAHAAVELRAAESAVEATHHRSTAAFREAFFPSLSVGGEGWLRSTSLSTSTPLGPIKAERDRVFRGLIELRTALFHWETMKTAREEAKFEREAANLRRAYAADEVRYMIGARGSELLVLQRHEEFTRASIDNIRQRRKDIARLIERGRASTSDLLKLDLAFERFSHRAEELRRSIDVRAAHLGRIIQLDPVREIQFPMVEWRPRSQPDEGIPLDVAAARSSSEATRVSASRPGLAMLPSVELFGRGVLSDDGRLTEKGWGEIGISARWELFGKGARYAEKKALLARASAERAEAERKAREHRFRRDEALSRLASHADLLVRLTRMEEPARRDRSSEERRLNEGRGSVSDLIDADTTLLEIRRDQDIARLELLDACMLYRLSNAMAVLPSCDFRAASE